MIISECWNPEPHERPTFKEILDTLEEIKCSSFIDTPEDSYVTMQEDWKIEIEQMFDELRLKEKVSSRKDSGARSNLRHKRQSCPSNK